MLDSVLRLTRFSIAMTWCPRSRRKIESWEPRNPQPPVIRTFNEIPPKKRPATAPWSDSRATNENRDTENSLTPRSRALSGRSAPRADRSRPSPERYSENERRQHDPKQIANAHHLRRPKPQTATTSSRYQESSATCRASGERRAPLEHKEALRPSRAAGGRDPCPHRLCTWTRRSLPLRGRRTAEVGCYSQKGIADSAKASLPIPAACALGANGQRRFAGHLRSGARQLPRPPELQTKALGLQASLVREHNRRRSTLPARCVLLETLCF